MTRTATITAVALAAACARSGIELEVVLDDISGDDHGATGGRSGSPPTGGADPGGSSTGTDNHTVHKAEVDGPYPHDDRFAVRFTYDITFKPENRRFTMNEVGLFTLKDGKIAKEEFFYAMRRAKNGRRVS